MQIYADFKLVEGCVPCSFSCVCCEGTYHRCSSNEQMYLWYNKHTRETLSVLCGRCYNYCPQGGGNHCTIRQQPAEEDQDPEKA